ncbi:MAG TPA: hypothetical protein VI749_02090 [Candidatus Omnitrophota bacterium]|nr:hypothetical protein [Candidatus Omnitrophota bacterium]
MSFKTIKQFGSYFIVFLFVLGCSISREIASPPVEVTTSQSVTVASLPQAQQTGDVSDQEQEPLEAEEIKTGVLFAKTNFQGALEKTYVRLLFEDLEVEQNKFNLYIGEKSALQAFPWDAKTVQPGYFFIELPAGKYRISSLSIPVGSTQATENMDITLEILPEKVVYAGTLVVNGTKEKIKLGGVPVLRPGFIYTALIMNEKEEALTVFRQRYPDQSKEVVTQLMQLHNESNREEYDG